MLQRNEVSLSEACETSIFFRARTHLGAADLNGSTEPQSPVVVALERQWSGSPKASGAGTAFPGHLDMLTGQGLGNILAGVFATCVPTWYRYHPSLLTKFVNGMSGGPGNGHLYAHVASKQLVGLYTSVWVRKSLLLSIKGVQVAAVSTGFGGYLGNKGGVIS